MVKLQHGGDIHTASAQYGIPESQWIDVSTGISPWSWPVPELPVEVLRRLPAEDGRLERAAAAYYGCDETVILAVPGSQYALQHLPRFIALGKVAMPVRGYAEHRQAWSNAGHSIVDYADTAELQTLVATGAVEHVLLINPNNPTAQRVSPDELLSMHSVLRSRGGYLVVDEAFADADVHLSLAAHCGQPGLIVFRSLGKFFGLAGIRLGFLLAPTSVLKALAVTLSPWMVSHPARWIGAAALQDVEWQTQQRTRLHQASQGWYETLLTLLPQFEVALNPLFISMIAPQIDCDALYRGLAERGILIRQFEAIAQQGMLRVGLPDDHERPAIEDAIKAVLRSQQVPHKKESV